MGCTTNGQEERITAKGVGSKLLPQVQQLREALCTNIDSLRYLWIKVQKRPPDRVERGEAILRGVDSLLVRAEEGLRRMEEL